MSSRQFLKAEHLLISPFGPVRNLVDHALQLHGHRRNVQTIVPSLFAALSIVENSDLIVTLPRRVAEKNARRFNIVHQPLPIDSGAFDLHAVRHTRDAQNSVHVWIFEQLNNRFECKEGEWLSAESPLDYLGMEISMDDDYIYLSMAKLIVCSRGLRLRRSATFRKWRATSQAPMLTQGAARDGLAFSSFVCCNVLWHSCCNHTKVRQQGLTRARLRRFLL